jgi:predicted  nucleic acid-binding Zn-ribbon protein
MPDFTDLKKRVAKQTDIQNSVLALLTGIVNEVQRVVRLQARAEDLAEQLVADAPDLAEAVAANLASEIAEVESTATERVQRLEREFGRLEDAHDSLRREHSELLRKTADLQKENVDLRSQLEQARARASASSDAPMQPPTPPLDAKTEDTSNRVSGTDQSPSREEAEEAKA